MVKNLPAMKEAKRCGSDSWVGKIPWSRKWQLALGFLPGKLHGQRSTMGSSSWATKSQNRLSTQSLF